MALTNPKAVESILGPENYDGETDLQPFIDSADILIQNISAYAIANLGMSPTNGQLEVIERWLAAHLYSQNNPAISSIGTGGINTGLQGQSTMNLRNSRWGQTVIMLDFTGYLNSIDNRAIARLVWLGTNKRPPCVPCPPYQP